MPRCLLATGIMLLACAGASLAAGRGHNVILFVADGLRGTSVDNRTAPAMASLAREGVWFRNGHSLFPTFTTANASAMATGHYFGDTGNYSNVLYTGFRVPGAAGSVTPFLENDEVLGDVDAHFAGDYLNEATILRLARDKGLSTAAIGKLGPTLIFDHTERSGASTIIVDDATGSPKGIPLSAEVSARLQTAGLASRPPSRGANNTAGNARTPGPKVANVVQQDWLTAVATRVVLPLFAERDKPFMLVFWSRDPDATQHVQGDSFLKLVPGINGPTSLAAVRNADDDLARIRATIDELGLRDTTDIIVTADHGFSTISKASATSQAAKRSYADTPPGLLPSGFLALDLAQSLGLPLIDPDLDYTPVPADGHPKRGNGLIGGDKDHPKVVVAANGGSDLIYVPDGDKAIAGRIVDALLAQDYVSGIFVASKLGTFAGTLSLADIALEGSAVTPMPAIVASFRSFDTVCGEPVRCAVEIADNGLQQGQGMHGTFSRADTWNFMAAIGPSFRAGWIDPAPASNADVGKTIAKILDLPLRDTGLVGRELQEAMPGGAAATWKSEVVASPPAANGLRTILNRQLVGETRYFDAAGFPGRTVGLTETAFENADQTTR